CIHVQWMLIELVVYIHAMCSAAFVSSCSLSCFLCSAYPTSVIYRFSLHDALPISSTFRWFRISLIRVARFCRRTLCRPRSRSARSEEHTSELQSHLNLVCRLLLEKKKPHRDVTSNRRSVII